MLVRSYTAATSPLIQALMTLMTMCLMAMVLSLATALQASLMLNLVRLLFGGHLLGVAATRVMLMPMCHLSLLIPS